MVNNVSLSSSRKKQVVFCINHYGGVVNAIWFRLVRHKGDKAVLLMPMWLGQDETLKRIVSKGIFNELIRYDDRNLNSFISVEDLDRATDKLFDYIVMSHGIILEDAEFYLTQDMTDPFAVYLSRHNIRYNMFEMSSNHFTHPDSYEGGHRDGWLKDALYTRQKEYGALEGEKSEYCHLILYKGTDERKIKNGDYEIVDFSDLSVYSDEERSLILSCYDTGLTNVGESCQLIVLPSLNMCAGHSIYNHWESVFILQLMMEYYSDRSLTPIIKPHPADDSRVLQKYFPEARIMPSSFPVDFIKLNPRIRIKSILSITSSAAAKLSELCDSITELRWVFYKGAPYLQRLYICVSMIRDLAPDIGVSESFLPKEIRKLQDGFINDFLLHTGFQSDASKEKTCLIADHPKLADFMTNDVILFFDECALSDVENPLAVMPIRIKYEPKDARCVFGSREEWVYVYS